VFYPRGVAVFDCLHGTITAVRDRDVTLTVGGIGFAVFVPQVAQFVIDTQAQLFIHFHWNAENGPSLYGFGSELDRQVFLMIIDCPKIGPTLALSILSRYSAGQFLEIITTANEAALSDVSGIGEKKAEQIIVTLKHKVQKLVNTGALAVEHQQGFVQWQQLNEVLLSLNYSKPEIVKVTSHLSEKYAGQNYPLDQLIRAALAYLSQKQA
jgi:holliday junction DNA helicase RuvA